MQPLLRKVDREVAKLIRSILQVSGMNSDINFLPLKEAHAYVLTHGMNAFLLLLLCYCYVLLFVQNFCLVAGFITW